MEKIKRINGFIWLNVEDSTFEFIFFHDQVFLFTFEVKKDHEHHLSSTKRDRMLEKLMCKDWLNYNWNVLLYFHFRFTLNNKKSWKEKSFNRNNLQESKFLHDFCSSNGISNWMLCNKCGVRAFLTILWVFRVSGNLFKIA